MNIFQNPQETANPKHFSTEIFTGLSISVFLHQYGPWRFITDFDSSISVILAMYSLSPYFCFHVDSCVSFVTYFNAYEDG